MKVNILYFGITTDLVAKTSEEVEIDDVSTLSDLKLLLMQKHKALTNLNDYAIAVNEEYAEDSLILKSNDVVAIIPPVSGG